jgi:hypothetical protein
VLIVDALLIKGIKFVLTRLAEVVEAELVDETHLREELLAAQMRLELGEIDDAEFAQIEDGVLAGLRDIRARKEAQGGTAPRQEIAAEKDARYRVESVEADLSHAAPASERQPEPDEPDVR